MADVDISPEPILAPEGEIPLPPQAMFAELDNSGATAPAATAAPMARRQVEPTVAALEFVGEKKPYVEIPLVYPFKWNGVVIETIVVRRLTVQQLGEFWDALPGDGRYERTDVYGLMCGLPGAVIRALPDPDGPRVTEAGFDFLPRALGGRAD